jgi:hypothetical protein
MGRGTIRLNGDCMENTIRRFRISDALVLTAAIAISIVACTLFNPGYVAERFPTLFVIRTFALVFTYALAFLILCDSVSLADSVTCPGKLGVILTSVMGVFAFAMNWHFLLVYDGAILDETFGQRVGSFFFVTLLDSDDFVPAYSTIAAWVTLRLKGEHCGQTDWIDRWGVILGIFWIVYALARNALNYQTEILQSVGITLV